MEKGLYNAMPPRPKLNDSGAYNKASLQKYLEDCSKGQIPIHRIATHLGVDLHRIIHLMNPDCLILR